MNYILCQVMTKIKECANIKSCPKIEPFNIFKRKWILTIYLNKRNVLLLEHIQLEDLLSNSKMYVVKNSIFDLSKRFTKNFDHKNVRIALSIHLLIHGYAVSQIIVLQCLFAHLYLKKYYSMKFYMKTTINMEIWYSNQNDI